MTQFMTHPLIICLLVDLKQELKIRNISLPLRNASAISAHSSPSKDNIVVNSNVSKFNDLNDSKNNNLSLNASMDKSTNSSFNNCSMLDATLHNNSSGVNNATGSTHKSHNDSSLNKSPQSVSKCM